MGTFINRRKMIKNIIFDLDGVLFDSFSQGFLNSEEGDRVCKLKQEITAEDSIIGFKAAVESKARVLKVNNTAMFLN